MSIPFLATADERIAHIVQLRIERAWTRDNTREMARACAAAWNVSEPTVRGYSAAANRILLDRIDERRSEAAELALDTLVELATPTGDPELDRTPVRLGAARDLLAFAGKDKPAESREHTVTVQTAAEARAELTRRIARLAAPGGEGTEDREPQ